MDKTFIPNLLIVAGVGRNSGKTTFACKLIKQLSADFEVIAIKISPHQHGETPISHLLGEGKGFRIFREMDASGKKDSSLFLAAGAQQVFYIEAGDDALELAWESLSAHLHPDKPWICEGGWLRKFIKPGLFVHCNVQNSSIIKESALELLPLADHLVTTEDSDVISKITFSNTGF